jgi:MFS superfamily sulfate permease-like transporter
VLPTQLKADLQAELNSALVAVKRSLVRRVHVSLPTGEAEELSRLLEDAPELASVAGLHVLLPRRALENLLEGKPVHAPR